MKHTTNKSYKDCLMVEVNQVIKNLDKKQPTKEIWWVVFVKYIKNIFKKLL